LRAGGKRRDCVQCVRVAGLASRAAAKSGPARLLLWSENVPVLRAIERASAVTGTAPPRVEAALTFNARSWLAQAEVSRDRLPLLRTLV
jgi:hypothetical protein